MNGFGYQLGKLLGTLVVTFYRNKNAFLLVIAVGLTCLFILIAFNTTNRKTAVGSEASILKPGGRAKISYFSRVNIRQSYGYINKPESDVVVTVPSGAVLEIVGGPQRADNLTWWRVRWDGWEGWIAEYTAGNRQILTPIL
jgi:hypothetical protein